MENEGNATQEARTSDVNAPDWSLLKELSNNQDIQIASEKVEKPEDKVNADVIESEKQEESKTDPPKGEEKKPESEAKSEVKSDESKNEPPVKPEFEISLKDLENAPKTYEEGTFQALAKELGYEIPEESFDAFKANFVPKTELEKIQQQTKESLFAQLKPETAAALEMLELDLPEELILQPTAQADAMLSHIEASLKLSDAELYRKVLENTEGWTPETIDTEIEELVSNGKIAHKAHVERINLQNDKKIIQGDKARILEIRDNTINKLKADKVRVAEQQKEQQTAQFMKVLDAKSDFMGFNVPKDFRDAVALKFRGGQYDNDLNDAASKVDFILFKELGPKYTKLLKESAFAKGKESEIQKSVNAPPKPNTASGQRSFEKETENTKAHPFEIFREDFKG